MSVHLAAYGEYVMCDCDGCRAERMEKVVAGLLEAFADFLTDLDDYPDPAPILAPLQDLNVDADTRDRWFSELLRCVVGRAAKATDDGHPWPSRVTEALGMLMGVS